MAKILLLQGGFNEEHKVSLNTSKEIAKSLKKLKINFKILTVNPVTFKDDILKYSNDYIKSCCKNDQFKSKTMHLFLL